MACAVDERKARLRPRRDTTVQVLRVVTELAQAPHGGGASCTTAADGDDATTRCELAQTLAQLTQWDVLSAVDVAGPPLVVLPHVHELMLGPRLAGIECIHTFILPRDEDDCGSGTMSASDHRIPSTSFRSSPNSSNVGACGSPIRCA